MPWRRTGGVEVLLHALVTLPLMEVSDQLQELKHDAKVKFSLCLSKYYTMKTYPMLN
jgi:hypothetical protein